MSTCNMKVVACGGPQENYDQLHSSRTFKLLSAQRFGFVAHNFSVLAHSHCSQLCFQQHQATRLIRIILSLSLS